jgi:hypothetical protein
MMPEELRAVYSAKYMIDVRLERLLKWKVLDQIDGRLVIRRRPSVWISYVFYCWSRILGFGWWR